MTTAAIVQARMGSSRLPGKVMMDLAGKTVLQHVLERCARIPGIDAVVCAIADEAESGLLAEVAQRSGAGVFVGPVCDVLARYQSAARLAKADVIVRVTSDCPLVDPVVCGQVVALRMESNADYACNILPRSYPKGLDCEVFTTATLELAATAATKPSDREHVTQWMLRAPELRRANLSSGDESLASLRWTLDYSEDLGFLQKVYALLPQRMALMEDVLALLKSYPELSAINAGMTDLTVSSQTEVKRVHE
jgi:glutamate-1-semialdehyde 2,1-aminomutase/spore coat polysaccharide biosynthesis protein SpsF